MKSGIAIHWLGRALIPFAIVAGLACAFPAKAAYKYTTINYPGAVSTAMWGINNSGKIVGQAIFDGVNPPLSFIYDAKTKVITPLPNLPGAFDTAAVGINRSEVLVGSAGDTASRTGFVLDKGAFTLFTHPGWAFTEGRAIGSSGLVTGWSYDADGTDSIGFIYDPAHKRFIDIRFSGSSTFTIAQGINGRGQVVGSARLDADIVYPGSPQGPYGFMRDRRGVFTLFRVNESRTRARGITASGKIAGFLTDEVTGIDRGFVVTLKNDGAGFESLIAGDDNLLDVPGSVGTIVEGIDDLGRVSGNWTDAAGASHGFLATPLRDEKEKD